MKVVQHSPRMTLCRLFPNAKTHQNTKKNKEREEETEIRAEVANRTGVAKRTTEGARRSTERGIRLAITGRNKRN